MSLSMELTNHEHHSEPRAALLRLLPAGWRSFVHHPRRPVLQHHRHRAGPGPGWQPPPGHRGPAHADRGAGPLGLVRLPPFPARRPAALAAALAHPRHAGPAGLPGVLLLGRPAGGRRCGHGDGHRLLSRHGGHPGAHHPGRKACPHLVPRHGPGPGGTRAAQPGQTARAPARPP